MILFTLLKSITGTFRKQISNFFRTALKAGSYYYRLHSEDRVSIMIDMIAICLCDFSINHGDGAVGHIGEAIVVSYN